MIKYLEKYPVGSLVFLSLLVLLPNIDALTVTIMEARNFITAREMITDGNWILTTMNGKARYEKPPLPTWLTALSGLIFGVKNLVALRLPTVVLIAFSGVFMFKLSKTMSNDTSFSIKSAIILISSFYIIAITNEAPWDIFTHGFMLAGIYFLYGFFSTKNSGIKNALAAGLFIGLSIMSKGPVSLYALFLPFLISYGIVYKYNSLKTKIIPLLACIAIFLIIGGWWFAYVRIVDPEAFIEITKKETSRWGSYNVRPIYYYWSFFLQSGIWAILALVSLMYPYLKNKVVQKDLYRFSFLWTVLAVVLLSIIPEKKSRYLVPVLFPLALNISVYIQYIVVNFKSLTKKEKIPFYIHYGLFALLGFAIPIAIPILFPIILSQYLLNYLILSIFLVAISFAIIRYARSKEMNRLFYTTPLFLGCIIMLGLPFSIAIQNNDKFESTASLHKVEFDNDIATYALKEPSPELIWHYGHKITVLESLNQLKALPEKQFGLLVDKNDVKLLSSIEQQYTIVFINDFNMNYGTKQKNRLIRSYYLISKKTTFE